MGGFWQRGALVDELPGVGAHDVRAQDLVCAGVRNELHHALGVVHAARAAVRHERELACLEHSAATLIRHNCPFWRP